MRSTREALAGEADRGGITQRRPMADVLPDGTTERDEPTARLRPMLSGADGELQQKLPKFTGSVDGAVHIVDERPGYGTDGMKPATQRVSAGFFPIVQCEWRRAPSILLEFENPIGQQINGFPQRQKLNADENDRHRNSDNGNDDSKHGGVPVGS